MRYTFKRRKTHQSNQLVSFLSGISIAGLVVGVSLLITVLSIMNGFERELREKILGLVPQAVITHQQGIEHWQPIAAKLLKEEGVLGVAPYVEVHGLIVRGKQAQPSLLFGINTEKEQSVSILNQYLSAQTLSALNTTPNALVLGFDVAKKLNVQQGGRILLVVPGDDATLSAAKTGYFTIIDIVKTQTELDSVLALSSIASVQPFLKNPNTVTGLRLSLDNIFNANYTVFRLSRRLGQGFSGTDWSRTHGNLYQAISMSKNLVGLLMSLIVAIAAFNVIATLILVVLDKQGNIAILRTLGLSSYQIMAVFMVQGSFIGLVGTGIGVVAGCGLSVLAQPMMQLVEAVTGLQFLKSDVYPLTYLPSEILLSDIVQVVSTALILSFIATIYPAWRASRVQPAQALRYQ